MRERARRHRGRVVAERHRPAVGTQLLDELEGGASADAALATIAAAAPHGAHRQLALVDAQGRSAAWSGARALGVHGTRTGHGWAAAGNLLASESVLDALGAAFAESAGELETRLIAALEAGLEAGGEEGPLHSAGVLVADAVEWPVTDLRVDWAAEPILELARLWDVWAPQRDDYVTRALDPGSAPALRRPGRLPCDHRAR